MEISRDCSFLGTDHTILVGVSRKRFVRNCYPDMDADLASAMVARMAVESGANIVRTHDVRTTLSELTKVESRD